MNFKIATSLLALSSAMCWGQSFVSQEMAPGPTSEPKKPISFDLSAIDKTADPCVNFYQYACGNWMKNNPIPSDQGRWSRFAELTQRNTWLLYQELKAAADAPKSPLQKKYGDYFAACMNVGLANKLGAEPIEPMLKTIASWDDKKKLASLLNDTQRNYALSFFFLFESGQDQKDSAREIGQLDQAGLALPDRSYYLDQDERSKTLRAQYVDHVTKMFVLVGDTPEQAAIEAKNVLDIETALAQGSMSRVDRRTPANRYHIMTIDELQALTPDFDWKVYMAGRKESDLKTVNVVPPNFFKTINQQLESADLSALKSYLRWQTVHRYAAGLGDAFDAENFRFFSATLNGQKEPTPRWRRCTQQTDRALGEAVGQDWVAQNFPPAAKDNMEKLVAALERALARDIQNLDWMSDTTKAEAEKKLAAFRQKIGYPDKWRDYSSLEIKRDDPIGNFNRVAAFDDHRRLSKIGKPVDEKEWTMTPPTVNAYYQSSMNDINFPAGILQPPFYDFKADPAVNFGGIGVVIGHEMTHGFDDQGAQYDPKGNVRVWFTKDDLAKFKERSECYAKEYDGFEVAPGQNLNGHLTLGENSADNAGIRIAFQALQNTLKEQGQKAEPGYVDGKRDGYTADQRFFISFAQVWCGTQTQQAAINQAKTNPHSTGEWRVKGTVQNFDEFGKAFGCKKGDPMMPASGGCRTW